jgi:hypothetical protein
MSSCIRFLENFVGKFFLSSILRCRLKCRSHSLDDIVQSSFKDTSSTMWRPVLRLLLRTQKNTKPKPSAFRFHNFTIMCVATLENVVQHSVRQSQSRACALVPMLFAADAIERRFHSQMPSSHAPWTEPFSHGIHITILAQHDKRRYNCTPANLELRC